LIFGTKQMAQGEATRRRTAQGQVPRRAGQDDREVLPRQPRDGPSRSPVPRGEMLTKVKVARFGRLKHGNPSGDFNTAPRCGARTRRGTACQCPAMRGRTRCRLHGGKSTGPRTAEGLARIRTANTRHGRWSRESTMLARCIREYQRNGLRSASAFPPEFRAQIRSRSLEPPTPRILAQMRERVRADLAREEQQRLDAKRHSE
jgi:hypothetical protein